MNVYIELDQSSAEQAQSIREQALKILRARKLSEQAVTDLDLIRITLPRALNNLGLDQPHYEKMVAAQYREENDLKPDQMTDEEILNNKIYSDDQRLSQVKTLELKTPDMKYPILMDFPDLQNLIQLMFYVQEDFLAEEWRLKDIRKYAEAMEDWCPMKILAMTYNGTLVTHFIQKWNSLGKEDLRIKCEAGWEAQQQFPDGYEMERAQLYQQLIMSAREKMFYEMILPPGVTNMDEDVESFIRIKAFYTTEGRPELAERAIEFMSEAPEWKGVQTWPEVEALTEKMWDYLDQTNAKAILPMETLEYITPRQLPFSLWGREGANQIWNQWMETRLKRGEMDSQIRAYLQCKAIREESIRAREAREWHETLMKDRAYYNKLAKEHQKIWAAEQAEMKAQEAKQPKQS
ncbi:MAG: hypothetical protein PUA61_06815 [Succinatimonas hippei]|nr:hypothetical protein [Succinatimonas hippei]